MRIQRLLVTLLNQKFDNYQLQYYELALIQYFSNNYKNEY